MKIFVNEEAVKTIQGMLDVSLRSGGLQNLNAVNTVINVLRVLSEEEIKKIEKGLNNATDKK